MGLHYVSSLHYVSGLHYVSSLHHVSSSQPFFTPVTLGSPFP